MNIRPEISAIEGNGLQLSATFLAADRRSQAGRYPPVFCACFRCCGFIFLLFLFFSRYCFCQAQDIGREKRLFSGATAARVSQHFADRDRYGRLNPNYSRGKSTLAQDIELDTVENVVWSSQKEAQFFAEYRGLSYFLYVRDVVDLGEFNHLGTASFAERLLLFQTAKTVGRFIVESPLEPMYRWTLNKLKRIDNYTTLHVVRAGSGGFDVDQGKTKGHRILEFKLHASAANGIEPRMRIGKHFVLRWDPLAQDTLLEFRKNF